MQSDTSPRATAVDGWRPALRKRMRRRVQRSLAGLRCWVPQPCHSNQLSEAAPRYRLPSCWKCANHSRGLESNTQGSARRRRHGGNGLLVYAEAAAPTQRAQNHRRGSRQFRGASFPKHCASLATEASRSLALPHLVATSCYREFLFTRPNKTCRRDIVSRP